MYAKKDREERGAFVGSSTYRHEGVHPKDRQLGLASFPRRSRSLVSREGERRDTRLETLGGRNRLLSQWWRFVTLGIIASMLIASMLAIGQSHGTPPEMTSMQQTRFLQIDMREASHEAAARKRRR